MILQTCIQFLLLSLENYLVCLVSEFVIVVVINQLHTEFHIRNSRFERFNWFNRARQRHALHHDHDMNFMVADHFWDRVFKRSKEIRLPTLTAKKYRRSDRLSAKGVRQLLFTAFVQPPNKSKVFTKPPR